MHMCRVALIGYGKMGRELEARAAHHEVEVCCVVDEEDSAKTLLEQHKPDVAIEFTQPNALLDNARICFELGIPIVIGTTGWESQKPAFIELAETLGGTYITGSNFSTGVLAMFDIVKHACSVVSQLPQYDAMVSELHHRYKKDAPGGTANHMIEIVQQEFVNKRQTRTDFSTGIADEELSVSVARVGETPGTHTVAFDSFADTIELTHRARNRSGFADGALQAAKWLSHNGGQHRFEDIYQKVSREAVHG